jgi:hypothetical protein
VLTLVVNLLMNKGEAFLTRILVKNNVVPLVLGDYLIVGK